MANTIKHSDDDLIKIVERYARTHHESKISVKELSEESGISMSTWYKRPNVMKVIDKINNAPINLQMDFAEIPSVNELYRKYGKNDESIKMVLEQLLSMVARSEKNANKYQNLVTENEKLKREIKEKDVAIRLLNDKINALIANNDSMINLSDNIDKMNRKTFGSQFGEMFGEDD